MTNIPYFYIFKYLNKWKNLVQLYTIFWQCLLPKVTTIWDKKQCYPVSHTAFSFADSIVAFINAYICMRS